MKGCLCVGTMSERVTEMSHAQANMMLDLVLSDGKVHADLDAKALVNLAEAAEVLGRSEDAELLKLYEKWVTTRDPRLYQQLLEKGLLTAFDTTGEYEQ